MSEPRRKKFSFRPAAQQVREEREARERAAEEKLQHARCMLDEAVCEQDTLKELRNKRNSEGASA